jgi:peptidoglycan/LPS O-acetylase OafA/YrhL
LIDRPLLAEAPTIKGRSDGIDLLRAIFALWVMFSHLIPWARRIQGPDAVPGWLYFFTDTIVDRLTQSTNELHPAVLCFIVLSGYCIHRNGLRRRDDSIPVFSIRRCFRILPVFFLASLIPLLTLHIGLSVNPAAVQKFYGSSPLDAACMVEKLSTLAAIVPFFHECSSQANGPLLTVMVEIVLYALYGAFFWFWILRGRERWIWRICAACYAAGLLVAAAVSVDDSSTNRLLYNWWQNSSVFGFLPYWWIGAVAISPEARGLLDRYFMALGWWLAALTLLLVGLWYFFGTSYETAVLAQLRQLVFALWAAALIVKVDGRAVTRFHFLPSVGRAGYSLYAFHAPILVCLLVLGVKWPVVFVALIAMGFVMYGLIEKPGMMLGKSIAARVAPGRTMMAR